MRKIIIALMIMGLFLISGSATQANSSVIDSTVTPFLNGLQSGEMESIAPYVGGELYKKMTSAYSRDAGYAAFLQSHYQGVSFSPEILEESGDSMIVRVIMASPGKKQRNIDLFLEETSSGDWHIVNQLEAP